MEKQPDERLLGKRQPANYLTRQLGEKQSGVKQSGEGSPGEG